MIWIWIGVIAVFAAAALYASDWAVWGRSRRPHWHRRRHRHWPHHDALPGDGISLLVPFLTDNSHRERNWKWLRRYWSYVLPGAELIVSPNHDRPFNKCRAVNMAFRHSTGDVIVIMDADAYLPAESILECAARVRADRRLWFIPYRHMYRLTKAATTILTDLSPDGPMLLKNPPPRGLWIDEGGSSSGHWFGALMQVMPREAFESVGGMDERFAGWGGEDVSFMRAVDTLYGRHKTFNGPAFHLWHSSVKVARNASDLETIRAARYREKRWQGQPRAVMNAGLTTRYAEAFMDIERMQALVDERRDLR